MIVADAGSRNTGSDIGTALPHCDVWRSAFAECDAADAVFAEIDAHAFTQADAFSNPESHALPFDSVSLASHYMTFGGRFRYFNAPQPVFLLLYKSPSHCFLLGVFKKHLRSVERAEAA